MIELTNVTKAYGSLVALDSLTLTIGQGEIFGFIGPNGAGKSTTMKILACLTRPDSGVARVGGLDVTIDGATIRTRVGYMPDFLGVYDDLTVDEYLQFFASAFRIRRGKRRPIVDSVLELTDLTAKKHAMVDSLSRGMQQRLGVARVLIHEPTVLLLDEPASGLDPRARIEMRELLVELGRMGKTIMVSSHILSELAEFCTSIGIIERGKLLYAGSIEDAYAKASAGERIVISLEEGSVPAAELARTLGSANGTIGALVGSAAAENGQLVLDLKPGVRSHHELIGVLMSSGARIASFTPKQIKLEDAFLRLTKGAVN
ncbi:MAG: ABC transporter ATP-binding protein [Phycisphaerales bacterium]